MTKRKLIAAFVGLSAVLGTAQMSAAEDQTVNVYTYREPGLILPLLDQFEAETGIKPVVLYANSGLIERVAAEGENSPADLVITVDIGNLAAAKEQGIYQPITSPAVLERVPEAYRDADGAWTALSLRARVFYASNDRVPETELSYNDIANPEWKGRLCMRTGQHVYNIGLFAFQLAHNGDEATEEWLSRVRDNLAMRPTGNDRAQVKAIFSGECDLAIGNTYYMGLMQTNQTEPEQQDWAKSAHIIFPTDQDSGTHVNVSGAILAKHAPNKANAEKLIEFLVSDQGQSIYAETNYEYPVVSSVAPSDIVSSWGNLVPDQIDLTEIAAQRKRASELVDAVGFDEGPQN